MSEVRNTRNGINKRLNAAREKIHGLKDMMETVQFGIQKGKKDLNLGDN